MDSCKVSPFIVQEFTLVNTANSAMLTFDRKTGIVKENTLLKMWICFQILILRNPFTAVT